MKVLYDWIQECVGEEMPDLKKFEELFTFHAFEIDGIEKVGDHEVIDVKVLPDRSSDCLSHRGIARELGTLTGKPLIKDPFREPASLAPVTEKIKITIHDGHACRRFGAALITGVTVTESPEWLKSRLHALGQRSINNVVDATNYVMLALGQPLHAYDAAKLTVRDGVWHLGVRMAHDGESITTLTNDTYTLKDTVQLIVDEHTDTPVSIAGIKGGKFAEIDQTTTSVILEAANFDPQITRKAAQLIKLQTDASKRFENNLSPEVVPYGLQGIVKLILNIAGGSCVGYADAYPNPVANSPVLVTRAHINALLGLTLTADTVDEILMRLGFSVVRDGDTWQVTAPFERTDISIPEDVIAEVGRVYGYEHVQGVLPERVTLSEYNSRYYYAEKMREVLVSEGFSEVITSSFKKKDEVELQNALASDKRFLRSSLHENISETLDKNMPNADLLGVTTVRVFEIGTVFSKTADGSDVAEHSALAIGVRTKQQGYSPKDDEQLKGILAKLEAGLGVTVDATITQGVLECDVTALIAKLPVPTAYSPFVSPENLLFTPYSAYPFISRDIALWVPETTTASNVEELIREQAGTLLMRVTCFDEFKKENKISYAFRLVFQSFEKTLTDDEVGKVMEAITTTLQSRGYEVR